MLKVEVQYFQGCPHAKTMLENVRAAKGSLDFEIDHVETLVETNEKAESVGFRGSPTLLIEGEDWERLPVPDKPALACRVYATLPTMEQIVDRIRQSQSIR